MSKKYTDKQMQHGAELAYFNFSDEDIERYQRTYPGEFPTTQEILMDRIANSENVYDIFYDHPNVLQDENRFDFLTKNKLDADLEEFDKNGTPIDIRQYADTYEEKYILSILYNRDFTGDYSKPFEPSNWCLADVENQNDTTGMYAATFVTNGRDSLKKNQGEVLVGYRGRDVSTGVFSDNLKGLANDGLIGKTQLTQSQATEQERSAAIYLESVMSNDKFNSVATTGSDLGGTLAMNAPILVDYSQRDMSKFVQGCSWDGMGNSKAFNKTYCDSINNLKDDLYHYKYSWQGFLLEQPTYHNYEIKLENPHYYGDYKRDLLGTVYFYGDSISDIPFEKSKNYLGWGADMFCDMFTSGKENSVGRIFMTNVLYGVSKYGEVIDIYADIFQRDENGAEKVWDSILALDPAVKKMAESYLEFKFALPNAFAISVLNNITHNDIPEQMYHALIEAAVLGIADEVPGVSNVFGGWDIANNITQDAKDIFAESSPNVLGENTTQTAANASVPSFAPSNDLSNKISGEIADVISSAGFSEDIDKNTFEMLKLKIHEEMYSANCSAFYSDLQDISDTDAYKMLNTDEMKNNLKALAVEAGMDDFNADSYIRNVAESYCLGRDKEAGLKEFKNDLAYNGIQFNSNLEQAFNNLYEKTGKCYTLEEMASMSKCTNEALFDQDITDIGTDCHDQQKNQSLEIE